MILGYLTASADAKKRQQKAGTTGTLPGRAAVKVDAGSTVIGSLGPILFAAITRLELSDRSTWLIL